MQRIWLTAADVLCCCCLLLQLQDLLQRLSGAQQLVARVLDLETINSQQQTVITSLQQQLAASEQQVAQLSSQLSAWQARGSSAEQQLCEAQQQLLVSTPRPKRELGLLADLLTAGEAQLVEQALIAGEQHVYVAGRSRAWYARLESVGDSTGGCRPAADACWQVHGCRRSFMMSYPWKPVRACSCEHGENVGLKGRHLSGPHALQRLAVGTRSVVECSLEGL